jgi:hypothetical protein
MRAVSVVIDALGFLGGLGLAVPFFLGEPKRVRLLLELWQRARAPTDAQADFDPLIEDEARHLANYWPLELFTAKWGVALISAAFLARMVISLFGG